MHNNSREAHKWAFLQTNLHFSWITSKALFEVLLVVEDQVNITSTLFGLLLISLEGSVFVSDCSKLQGASGPTYFVVTVSTS